MASSMSRTPETRPVPAPSNPVLLAAQAQWLFTDEELTRTPSQLDGMPLEAEHTSRSKGVNFITQVGIMLKLPQLTLATAAVYLHRFFMRYSIVDLPQRPGMHPYPIAATSLFLATKVEENVRRMKELVVACCRVAQKQPNLLVDEQTPDFWKWRDTILLHEGLLLEALCFDLQLEQPYRILYDFTCFFGVNENKPLRNAAWAFVNDSMFTVLCLQFPARTIAAAALYAAARHCDVAFEDDGLGRPWWDQLDVDLTHVRRACTRMAQLYENNALQRHSQYFPTTPIVSDETPEKTRIPYAGSPAGTTPRGEADNINGQKRSREPEEVSRACSSSQTQAPSQNGERSPKRQRVGSGAGKPTAPFDSPPASTSSHHHPHHSHRRPSYSDRPHTNGHLQPSPHQPQPTHSHNRYQQSSQRPYPRGDGDPHLPPTGGNSSTSSDPIQERIDQIVQQNMPPTQDRPPREHGRSGRRYSADRYRDQDDPDRRRRFSNVSAASRGSADEQQQHDIPPPPPQDPPSQPDPPPNPPDDDEGGGSEEGEL
ncbi:cyclin-like protein [Aspergillus ambiguus]|uniref:putative cyclin n=1 Tax=Aspergillus ambiguus TaxID=176160 RepID=UPI003CCCC7C7